MKDMANNHQEEFLRAKVDPTQVFDRPEQVLQHDAYSREEKITVLQRWRYDALELEVAAEENMSGEDESRNVLQRIINALMELGAEFHPDDIPPTKQGGE